MTFASRSNKQSSNRAALTGGFSCLWALLLYAYEALGKDPFDDAPGDGGEEVEVTQSTTDPESGMFVKGEHERNFAYMAQTACNRHGFVLGYEVVPGNVHDSRSFWKLYGNIQNLDADYLMADSAFKTPAILRQLFKD